MLLLRTRRMRREFCYHRAKAAASSKYIQGARPNLGSENLNTSWHIRMQKHARHASNNRTFAWGNAHTTRNHTHSPGALAKNRTRIDKREVIAGMMRQGWAR